MKSIACIATAALLAAGAAPASTPRVTCRIDTDRDVLLADTSQRAVIKVSLRGAELASPRERPPVNLAIVLDRSGSMSGDKIERARDAAVEVLRQLDGRDRFSLVMYYLEVETLVPSQFASNAEWIEDRIRSIRSRGNTALFAGVSQGAAEVRKHVESRAYVPRILLLSDGLANVGPSSPEDLGRLGAALLKEGIAVSTVGVGTDYNEDLMTRLSQQSDGNAYFAATSADLRRIFNAELGSVLNVVARQVVIEIVCDEDVRPLRIIGREGRIRGNRVELTLNQIYGGQEKYALIEVEVPASGAGARRPLATATCRYEDALTQRADRADASVSVRFSREQEDVDRSVRPAVTIEIARNAAALARDEAIGLNDKGRNKEAQDALTLASARLRALGEKYKLPDVVREAEALEAAAPALAQPLAPAARKGMRTDNYQIYNQQMQ